MPPAGVILCPACRYDLVGSPDGACPECGTPFTHAELRARAIRDASKRRAADVAVPAWVLRPFIVGCGVLAVCRFLPSDPPQFWTGKAWPLALWLLTIAWAGAVLRDGVRFSWGNVLTLALPILVTITEDMTQHGGGPTRSGLAMLGIYLALVANVWVRAWVRAIAMCAAATAAAITMLGLLMTLPAAVALAQGDFWSEWPDPRSGYVYDQYPLTQCEVLVVGTAAAVAGLVLLGALAFVARRAAHSRLSFPDSSAPAP